MSPVFGLRALIVMLTTAVSAFVILGLYASYGHVHANDFVLDLGVITAPARAYTTFLGLWFSFGSWATILLAIALTVLLSGRGVAGRLRARFDRIPDAVWVVAMAIIAVTVAVLVRHHVLLRQSIVDDESAYRFMAQLLSEGRLWADTHPLAAAFDRKFMINDGKFYSQYFMGWPALMVPGVLLQLPEYSAAAYFGLTVPPLFAVVRRLAGRGWARAATLVLVSAPMLVAGAATEMAHASCLALLGWLHWFTLRSTDDRAPWWVHAGVASTFGLLFFVRPTPAIGGGGPLLAYWLWHAWQRPWSVRWRSAIAFVVPGVLFAAAFLEVNALQNGDPFKTAYTRAIEFAQEINFRNYGGPRHDELTDLFQSRPSVVFTTLTTAVFRLNFAMFGWPCSYLFALFALNDRRVRVVWASILGLFATHMFVRSLGVDSFGPVKYYESAWPFLVLTGVGLHHASTILARWRVTQSGSAVPIQLELVPMATLLALVLTTAFGYTAFRMQGLRMMAEKIQMPLALIESRGVHDAIVFTQRHWAPRTCPGNPTKHFVYARPLHSPDMTDDLIFVNDRGLRPNEELLEYFPERSAWTLRWRPDCTFTLTEFPPLKLPRRRK